MTSCGLTDPLPTLVADASAVINLIASGVARPLTESLPVRLRVVSAVASELAVGNRRVWNNAEGLATLVDAGAVEIVDLDSPALECFESLVVGTCGGYAG